MVQTSKKTVLITGAAGGIGAAIAESFPSDKYNLILNYNTSYAVELAKKLNAEIFKADVTKEGEIEAMRSFVTERFGGVDILINNAGVSVTKVLQEHTTDDIERILDTNLKGAILVTRAFIPEMISNRYGKIINISSIFGETGASCETVYSASKAGLIGFTKALAKELAPSNVNVNCVTPGFILTKMNDNLSPSDAEAVISEIPLGRAGLPSDVANAVFFLASDNSDFITGQILGVNGGF